MLKAHRIGFNNLWLMEDVSLHGDGMLIGPIYVGEILGYTITV
jgi:hypothetical protein